jgi:mRNA interferase MazF
VSRGEVYTAATRGAYTGKPRPVVIIQDDRFDATASVTVCPFTTNPVDAPLTRVPIEVSALNGLEQPSKVMIDKITTMPRDSLRDRLGRLGENDLVRLNRALVVFLGLAD